ncbi:MAG: hypothetical protein SynsKO_34250 [Synoicihabitans sp.]
MPNPSLPRLPTALLLSLLAASLSAEPRTVHSQNSAPRQHHLFVGAELFVRQGEELVTVDRIRGNNARVADPVPEYVSIRKANGLHWRMNTKVSSVKAEITGYKADATQAVDIRAFAEQAALQNFLSEQQDQMNASQGQLEARAQEAASMADSDDPEIRAAGLQAQAEVQTEMSDLSGDLSNIESILESSQMGDDIHSMGDGSNNAIDITFKVSSPVELADAYVFISVRVFADDRIRDTSFYRHIGQVGPKPRKVTFIRDGFPPGFEIKDTKIYLYSFGEEIPTNMSEKHYQLTYEEAREFLHLSYLGENRRETVPASPAWSLAPPALLSNRNEQMYDFPVTVELDEKGQLVGIKDNNTIVPEPVREVVQQLTYFPALENGSPVASTITVNPADFYKN